MQADPGFSIEPHSNTVHDPLWVRPDGKALDVAEASAEAVPSPSKGARVLKIFKGDPVLIEATGHPLGDDSVILAESNPDAYIYVKSVDSDGPAWRCGLRPGDVIDRINGECVASHGVTDILKAFDESTSPIEVKVLTLKTLAQSEASEEEAVSTNWQDESTLSDYDLSDVDPNEPDPMSSFASDGSQNLSLSREFNSSLRLQIPPTAQWNADLLELDGIAGLAAFIREARIRAMDFFAAVDTAKMRAVSDDDMRTALRDMGIPLSDEKLHALVASIEHSRGDTITFTTLKRTLDTYSQPQSQPSATASEMSVRSLIPKDVQWDTELLETKPLSALAQFVDDASVRLRDFYDAIDKENNKSITFEQMCAALIELSIPLAGADVEAMVSEIGRSTTKKITFITLKRALDKFQPARSGNRTMFGQSGDLASAIAREKKSSAADLDDFIEQERISQQGAEERRKSQNLTALRRTTPFECLSLSFTEQGGVVGALSEKIPSAESSNEEEEEKEETEEEDEDEEVEEEEEEIEDGSTGIAPLNASETGESVHYQVEALNVPPNMAAIRKDMEAYDSSADFETDLLQHVAHRQDRLTMEPGRMSSEYLVVTGRDEDEGDDIETITEIQHDLQVHKETEEELEAEVLHSVDERLWQLLPNNSVLSAESVKDTSSVPSDEYLVVTGRESTDNGSAIGELLPTAPEPAAILSRGSTESPDSEYITIGDDNAQSHIEDSPVQKLERVVDTQTDAEEYLMIGDDSNVGTRVKKSQLPVPVESQLAAGSVTSLERRRKYKLGPAPPPPKQNSDLPEHETSKTQALLLADNTPQSPHPIPLQSAQESVSDISTTTIQSDKTSHRVSEHDSSDVVVGGTVQDRIKALMLKNERRSMQRAAPQMSQHVRSEARAFESQHTSHEPEQVVSSPPKRMEPTRTALSQPTNPLGPTEEQPLGNTPQESVTCREFDQHSEALTVADLMASRSALERDSRAVLSNSLDSQAPRSTALTPLSPLSPIRETPTSENGTPGVLSPPTPPNRSSLAQQANETRSSLLSQLNAERSKVQNLESRDQDLHALEAEVALLSNKITSLKAEKERALLSAQASREEAQKARDDCAIAERQRDTALKDVAELQAEADVQWGLLDEVEEHLSTSDANLVAVEKQRAALSAENHKLCSEVRQLKNETQRLRAHVDGLQSRLDAETSRETDIRTQLSIARAEARQFADARVTEIAELKAARLRIEMLESQVEGSRSVGPPSVSETPEPLGEGIDNLFRTMSDLETGIGLTLADTQMWLEKRRCTRNPSQHK
eukprot:m.161508 g.161508  ORF g.161508 m.161508 type:complete len:1297 (-) comp14577_c0_seq2:1716-5606(-)